MHQQKTEKKHLKYKNGIPTVIVHAGYINKTTTLPLPTEEDWRQDIPEDYDIGYVNSISSSPEETPIDTK